jgi:hypothetical protein
MSRYCVRIGLWIRPTEPADDIDAFTDELAEELLNLDPDAELMGSVARGEFHAWVHHEAASLEQAVTAASATVRAAGHAAGADTPVAVRGRVAAVGRGAQRRGARRR